MLRWEEIESDPRYLHAPEEEKRAYKAKYEKSYGPVPERIRTPMGQDWLGQLSAEETAGVRRQIGPGTGAERSARLAGLIGRPTEEEAAATAEAAGGGTLRRLGESFVSGASESTTGRALAALGGPTPVHVEPRTAPERIARGVGGITGSPFIMAGSALGPAGTAAGFGAEEVARGALEGKPPLKIAKQAGGAALLGGAVGLAGPSLRALGGEAAAALAGGGPVQAGVRFLARHGIPIAGEAGVFGVGGEALAPLTEGRPAEARKALEATTETAGMMGVLHGLGAIDRLRARLAPAGRAGVGKAPAIPPAAPVAPGPSTSAVPETPLVQPSAEAGRGGAVGRAAVLRGGAVEGSTPGVPGAGEVQPAPGTAAPAIAVAPAPNNVMERAKLAADAEKGGQVAGAKPPDVYPKAPAEPQQGVLDVARQARARDLIGAPTEGAAVAPPLTSAEPPLSTPLGTPPLNLADALAQANEAEMAGNVAEAERLRREADRLFGTQRGRPPGPP